MFTSKLLNAHFDANERQSPDNPLVCGVVQTELAAAEWETVVTNNIARVAREVADRQ